MQARVIYRGDPISQNMELPDDIAVGTEIELTIKRPGPKHSIRTFVTRITTLSNAGELTHEVEVSLTRPGEATRMFVATVPDGPHLLASDIAVMVMLVNSRIIEGNAGSEILDLQKRLNALIPSVLLKDGANPTAIPLYKDV